MNDKPMPERNEPGRRNGRELERSGLPAEDVRDARPALYQRDRQSYPAESEGEEKSLDIFKYLRILSKYRWLIAGVALAALALSAVSTYMMTPIYRATASIQIEREAFNVIDKGEVSSRTRRLRILPDAVSAAVEPHPCGARRDRPRTRRRQGLQCPGLTHSLQLRQGRR